MAVLGCVSRVKHVAELYIKQRVVQIFIVLPLNIFISNVVVLLGRLLRNGHHFQRLKILLHGESLQTLYLKRLCHHFGLSSLLPQFLQHLLSLGSRPVAQHACFRHRVLRHLQMLVNRRARNAILLLAVRRVSLGEIIFPQAYTGTCNNIFLRHRHLQGDP